MRTADRGLVATVLADQNGRFSFSLPSGTWYSLFGWQDVNNNTLLDLGSFEPCGWYTNGGAQTWMLPVFAGSSASALSFALHGISAFPAQATAPNGRLQQLQGRTVVWLRSVRGLRAALPARPATDTRFDQLHQSDRFVCSGDAKSRGYAHGRLLAPHIVSFFRFFTLESTTASVAQYTQQVGAVAALRTQSLWTHSVLP